MCVFLHWASINSEIFAQLKEHYMVKVLIRIETGIYPSGINKYLDTMYPLLYYINHNTHNTQSCIQNKVLGNEFTSSTKDRERQWRMKGNRNMYLSLALSGSLWGPFYCPLSVFGYHLSRNVAVCPVKIIVRTVTRKNCH